MEAIAQMQQAVDVASGVLTGGPLPGDAEGQQRARQAAYKAIGKPKKLDGTTSLMM